MEVSNKKKSNREKLIDAQFDLIKTTGEVSGNIKDILYLENLQERRNKIQYVKNEIEEIVEDIFMISEVLQIDINEILERKRMVEE